jgi:hypothetical protein
MARTTPPRNLTFQHIKPLWPCRANIDVVWLPISREEKEKEEGLVRDTSQPSSLVRFSLLDDVDDQNLGDTTLYMSR